MLYCTVLPVRIWTLYEAVCTNVLVGQGCGGLILTAVADIYSTTYNIHICRHKLEPGLVYLPCDGDVAYRIF